MDRIEVFFRNGCVQVVLGAIGAICSLLALAALR